MLELFPEGFEEEARGTGSSSRAMATPSARRRCETNSRASRRSTSRRAGRTAGANSTAASASARSGSARPGRSRPPDATAVVDRPGPCLRHRSASDDAALPRAAPAVPPGSLLDVGCGSGVLAIAAAKLGFAPVPRSTTTRPRSRRRARTPTATASRSRLARRRARRPAPEADVGRREHLARRSSGSRRGCSTRAARHLRATSTARAGARRLDARRPRRSSTAGRPISGADEVEFGRRWRPSRFISWAARCRTPTRRPSASGCSRTATRGAKARPTSPSSTPAA